MIDVSLTLTNPGGDFFQHLTLVNIKHSGSAIFLSPRAMYHSDRCEALRAATARGEVKLISYARRGYPGQPMPAHMLPEISTVGYWDAPRPQSWGLATHRNEGIEITFIARGKTDFVVDGNKRTLESGDLVITRPWQPHQIGCPNVGACQLCWLILDVGVRRPDQNWRWPKWLMLSEADRQRLTTLLSHNEQAIWRANAEIRASFAKMAPLLETHKPAAAQSRLVLHINELMVALLDLLGAETMPLDPRLASTKRSVEMFLTALPQHLERSWTLAEMAQECGLGRSRFADYCRQIVNLTPSEYLTRCRVETAKQRLQTGESVTDVALSCGFQSSQYFATVFKRLTGQTPREFRRQQRGHNQDCL